MHWRPMTVIRALCGSSVLCVLHKLHVSFVVHVSTVNAIIDAFVMLIANPQAEPLRHQCRVAEITTPRSDAASEHVY